MKYKENLYYNNNHETEHLHPTTKPNRVRISFIYPLLLAIIISILGGYYYGLYASTGGYNYYVSYILDKNESLENLSKEFLPLMSTSMGIKKIMAANGLSARAINGSQIKGTALWIPTQKNLKPFYIAIYDSIVGYNYFFEYEIRAGDTLETLANSMLPHMDADKGIQKILSANNIDPRHPNATNLDFIAPTTSTKQKVSSTNNNVEETMSLTINNIKNIPLIQGMTIWIPTGRLAPYIEYY